MPHLEDVPEVEFHPADCACFVCYCIRLQSACSEADRVRNRKLCLV